jgi:hypothetical protein
MPKKPSDHGRDRRGEMPRTDLPPTKEPYDEGYFGTGEEENVVQEREAPAGEEPEEPRKP